MIGRRGNVRADGDLNKRRIYDLSELFCAPQVRYNNDRTLYFTHHTQGPEEMCLLEYQNPSKTSEKMGYFSRVTVLLHIL